MQVTATAKYVHMAPRKVRLVARSIRGMTPEEALATLAFIPNRGGDVVARVVKSATANAENNYGLDRAALRVSRVLVDEGPALRRFRAKARGRPGPYRHRFSHVTVVVDDEKA